MAEVLSLRTRRERGKGRGQQALLCSGAGLMQERGLRLPQKEDEEDAETGEKERESNVKLLERRKESRNVTEKGGKTEGI